MNRRYSLLLEMSTLLLLVGASLAGCMGPASHDEIGLRQYASPEYLWTGNPCGYLEIQRPLFNISGWLTGSTEPNVTVDLYVAPNESLETALEVVMRCRPIGNAQADRNGRFTLVNLPAGRYFVALPSREFRQMQGFPVIEEQKSSEYAVRMLWYGGSFSYSIAAFSVSPRAGPEGSRAGLP